MSQGGECQTNTIDPAFIRNSRKLKETLPPGSILHRLHHHERRVYSMPFTTLKMQLFLLGISTIGAGILASRPRWAFSSGEIRATSLAARSEPRQEQKPDAKA